MLDEIREFEQYCLPDGEKEQKENVRLKHRTISDSLSGIDRAFTVIARRFLCGAEGEPDFIDKEAAFQDQLKATDAVLRAWCGFEQEAPETGLTEEGKAQFEKMRNSLPTFFLKLAAEQSGIKENEKFGEINEMIRGTVKKTLERCQGRASLTEAIGCFEEICETYHQSKENQDQKADGSKQMYAERMLNGGLKKLKEREKSFGYHAVTSLEYDLDHQDANTLKVTNFRHAEAAAKNLGPLKRQVVISGRGDFTGMVYKKTKMKTIRIKTEGDRDIVTRFVFAWLLERERNGGGSRRAEIINTAELINWAMGVPHLERSKRELFLWTKNEETETMFHTPKAYAAENQSNVLKISLAPDFYRNWADSLKILPDDEEKIEEYIRNYQKEHEGKGDFVLWRDKGAGSALEILRGEEIDAVRKINEENEHADNQ